MSIWLLLLYALAMVTLVVDGPEPRLAYHIIATLSLAGFLAAVIKGGIRKPVV